MKATFDFEGQVVLVTGGASGIGLATVHALAAAHASVGVADLPAEAAEEVAAMGRAPRPPPTSTPPTGWRIRPPIQRRVSVTPRAISMI